LHSALSVHPGADVRINSELFMIKAPPPVCDVFPPFQRDALVRAAKRRDWRAIDTVTDDLVRLGLCRPRHDNVMPTVAEAAQRLARVRGVGAA